MSNSDEFLYTNRFTNKDVPSIDYDNAEKERKKVQFSNYYESRNGMPLNLLDDEDINPRYSLQDIMNTNMYQGGHSGGGGGGGGTLRYQKIRKKIISIDSRDRDTTTYPEPNKYRVYFGEKFVNIKNVRLVSTEFPNTEQVIRSQPINKKNNKIYWKNSVDGNDLEGGKDRTIYSITITDGNYSSSRFASELKSKMNAVLRSSAAPTLSVNKLHDFTVSVNSTTNIFQISQNDSFTISNPISVVKDSGILTISQSSHGLSTGTVINIASSSKVGGIPSSTINSSHIVTVPFDSVDYIVEDSGLTRIRTGLVDTTLSGTVNTTLNSKIVTGHGTSFKSLSNGATIHIGNYDYNIRTVLNDIQLTLYQKSLEDINGTFVIDKIESHVDGLIIKSKQHGISQPILEYPSTTILITGTGLYDNSYVVKNIISPNTFTVPEDSYTTDYNKNANETGKYTYTTQATSISGHDTSDFEISRKYYLSKRLTGIVSINIDSSTLSGSRTRYLQETFEAPSILRTGVASAFESSSNIIGSVSNASVTYHSSPTIGNLYFESPSPDGNSQYSLAGQSVTASPSEIEYKIKLKDVTLPTNDTANGNTLEERVFFCSTPNYSSVDTSLEFETPVIKVEENKSYKFDLSDSSMENKIIYFSNGDVFTGAPRYTTGYTESALSDQPGNPDSFNKLSIDSLTPSKLYYYVQDRGIIASMEDDGGQTRVNTATLHGLNDSTHTQYDGNAPVFYLTDINGNKPDEYDSVYSSFTTTTDSITLTTIPYSHNSSIIYWNFRHNGYKDLAGINVEKGHLSKVSSDTSYLGNANYGFNTANLSISNDVVFLNGNVVNVMSDGTDWNGVGKAKFWAPNHGLTTLTNKIAIFNSKVSTKDTIDYYGRLGKNAIGGTQINNIYANNISSISGGTHVNDIVIQVTSGHKLNATDDFIIIKGFGGTPYNDINGLYRAKIDSATQFIVRRQGANSLTLGTIQPGNIRYYGIGYNGEYTIDSVTRDTFTIDHPYMGSENGDWGEILEASNGYKVYPVNESSIFELGTKFMTELSTDDKITIGGDSTATSELIVNNKSNDNTLTLTTNVSSTLTDKYIYKNVGDHGLSTADNLVFLKSSTVSSTDFASSKSIDRINHFEFTTNTTIDQFKSGSNSDGFDFNNGDRRWHDVNDWRHDSKYNITVNRTATETSNNRGGDSVRIGTAVKFSFLFSYTDTPGELLGFANVGQQYKGFIPETPVGFPRYYGDTEYNAVQSNTTKVDIIDIDNSQASTDTSYTGYTKITTSSTHSFETGDTIFIEGHSGSSNDLAINDDGGHVIDRPDNLGHTSFYITIPITISGSGGTVYRKQLYKPFSLSGENYVYLKIPTLSSISSTSTNVSSIFAKILLDAPPGSILFNSYVSSDKVFEEVPLNELDNLDIEIVDPKGELFEFNNTDHSFSLEITSYVDIVKGSGVSSRTGQTDET